MVECAIGMLKAKFPCLNFLKLKTPEKKGRIFLACVTLHNLQLKRNNYNFFENVDVNSGYIEQNFITADDRIAQIVAQFESEQT